MQVNVQPTFETDSLEYEQLKNAVYETADVEGFTIEIGLRSGGGTMHMMDALIESETYKTKIHCAVDPYGNIDYDHNDEEIRKVDYTNHMRDDCLLNIYLYIVLTEGKIDFKFFNLEDSEFFAKYKDGIPIYNDKKTILNKYSAIHLDGPHSKRVLVPEIDFFHARTDPGAQIIFDDCDLYDHDTIHGFMTTLGWERVFKGERKQRYRKS